MSSKNQLGKSSNGQQTQDKPNRKKILNNQQVLTESQKN